MGLFGRARRALRRKGIRYAVAEALPHLHRHHLRERLPRRRTELNGVPVRCGRALDGLVPWHVGHPDPSEYEAAILAALSEHVQPSDTVVVVGGGWGVSTTVAAEHASDGRVYTYEASPAYADYVRETAALNGVADRVEVRNAVVSRAESTRGDAVSETVVAPSALPACDVLELDCEGAELDVLAGLDGRPRTIVVETHGMHGAPTDAVAERLETMGYEVVSERPAEGGSRTAFCEENDVYVLTAVRQ